jgi:phosphatidylglycerol---prolipoprotein diacylglyceryl transferase
MYPRFLQFGLLVISTYGVLTLVAAACAVALWASLARRSGLDPARISNAALLSVVSLIAGARLAIVAANWRGLRVAPLLILFAGTMQSGVAALCGVLLAAIVACIYLRHAGLPVLPSLDTAAPALAVAAAVLDVADFAAGSNYGASTTLPWAVTYTSRFAARTTGVPLGVPLHPVQLYAALAHFALAALLIALLQRRCRAGAVLGTALFAEGLLRFLLAPLGGGYRDAPVALFGLVTIGQAAGMLLVTLGGTLWLTRERAGGAHDRASNAKVAADV